MFYRFDLNKWVLMVLPPILRKGLIYSLLKALVAPLQVIYERFEELRKKTDDTLSFNAHTMYLERALCRLLHLRDGSVYIKDFIDNDRLYLSFKHEINERNYIGSSSDDETIYISSRRPVPLVGRFIIYIPTASASDSNIAIVKRWTNFYKYAGTEFIVKTY